MAGWAAMPTSPPANVRRRRSLPTSPLAAASDASEARVAGLAATGNAGGVRRDGRRRPGLTEEDPVRAQVLAAASRLVGQELQVVEALRPWMFRCREVASGRTVVVKRPRLAPGEPWDRSALPAVTFLTEVAALTLLGPHGPGLIGADLDVGILVMPDLSPASGLDPLLLTGTAEAATQGLLRWAEALGALHATAAGRRSQYEAIREPLGPNPPGNVRRRVPALIEALSGLGLDAPVDELHAALDPSGDPELDTWMHRDPCPDNVLLQPFGARILDFEFGAFGPPSGDAAFLRMGMPTCWCAGTVPEPVVAAVEARYRQAAAVGLPALADDTRWSAALADGAALHLAMTLVWFVPPGLTADETFGLATNRERVMSRLALFDPGERWPALRQLAEALAPVLRERWGSVGLRPFPAFR
jgi:hypothetical protein